MIHPPFMHNETHNSPTPTRPRHILFTRRTHAGNRHSVRSRPWLCSPRRKPSSKDVRTGPACSVERERAVLAVLVEHHGRVVDRSSLRHQAGLGELNPRRCDALLVRVRAALGDDAIVTVRRRGWMLRTEAIAIAAAIVAALPG